MEIYVKCLIFYTCSFFWFSNTILSDELTLPVSQLQTQQVVTSHIRSHIEYLTNLYNLVLIL